MSFHPGSFMSSGTNVCQPWYSLKVQEETKPNKSNSGSSKSRAMSYNLKDSKDHIDLLKGLANVDQSVAQPFRSEKVVGELRPRFAKKPR